MIAEHSIDKRKSPATPAEKANAMHSFRSRLRDNLQAIAPAPAASNHSLSATIKNGDVADLIPQVLAFIDAPALSVSQLPDAATLTFTFLECSDGALSSVLASTVIGVQTGAGGVGAAAASFAARPTYAGGAFYWGLRIDASSGVAVSGVVFTLGIALTGTPG